ASAVQDAHGALRRGGGGAQRGNGPRGEQAEAGGFLAAVDDFGDGPAGPFGVAGRGQQGAGGLQRRDGRYQGEAGAGAGGPLGGEGLGGAGGGAVPLRSFGPLGEDRARRHNGAG